MHRRHKFSNVMKGLEKKTKAELDYIAKHGFYTGPYGKLINDIVTPDIKYEEKNQPLDFNPLNDPDKKFEDTDFDSDGDGDSTSANDSDSDKGGEGDEDIDYFPFDDPVWENFSKKEYDKSFKITSWKLKGYQKTEDLRKLINLIRGSLHRDHYYKPDEPKMADTRDVYLKHAKKYVIQVSKLKTIYNKRKKEALINENLV